MTEENQEIELHDDENEIVEAQAHDPKNAEAQSVASIDKAGSLMSTSNSLDEEFQTLIDQLANIR